MIAIVSITHLPPVSQGGAIRLILSDHLHKKGIEYMDLLYLLIGQHIILQKFQKEKNQRVIQIDAWFQPVKIADQNLDRIFLVSVLIIHLIYCIIFHHFIILVPPIFIFKF